MNMGIDTRLSKAILKAAAVWFTQLRGGECRNSHAKW